MKHLGRKVILATAAAGLAVSGVALLAVNVIGPSYASQTTLPFVGPPTSSPATPVSCYGPETLDFKGTGKGDTTSPAQGGIACAAATTGNMIVNATLVSGIATSCKTIEFHGSPPVGGTVDVPVSEALTAAGTTVKPIVNGDTYNGSAQLIDCSPGDASKMTFTLSVG